MRSQAGIHGATLEEIKPIASRRSPYAAAARDHCHGRKLKCSGDRPCIRCKKQSLSCSYPMKISSSSAPKNDSSLSQRLPDAQRDNTIGKTLLTSIDDLQRHLDDSRSKLRDATVSGLPESAFPSPSEAVLQIRGSDGDLKNNLALLKPDSDLVDTLYAGPTSFAWGMVSSVNRCIPRSRHPVEIPNFEGETADTTFERISGHR